MADIFRPHGLAMLVGSQPLQDHDTALRRVFEYASRIPNWVQLPSNAGEGMLEQFMLGLPGLVEEGDRCYVDTAAGDFDAQMLEFFEEYLLLSEQGQGWDQSRFVLTPAAAQGFFSLLDALASATGEWEALKGQITGPITFCTGMRDHEKRAIFYHDSLREAAVKLLALKAAWQAKMLQKAGSGVPVIVFIDEPALAGYGSSEFISISREEIDACLREVIAAIHDQGALAGVHVCANTDWSLLFDSEADIINFDAHGFFDKFILYGDRLEDYFASGRFLAWGLVPTLRVEQIEAATVDTLWQEWRAKVDCLVSMGLDCDTIRAQSFITPSCGTGSLTPELGRKVLALTRALSRRIRKGA